jgi:hypothetical protein
MTLFSLLLLTAATSAQVVIPPGTQLEPDRPRQQQQQRGPSYGPIGPGISVDSVLIRRQAPLLTLSDVTSGKDATVRNFGGDLRFGFFEGGFIGRTDFTRYDDHLVLKPDGNLGIGVDHPAHRLSIGGGPSWTSNGWKGAVELENGAALAWKPNAAGESFGIGHTNGGFYFFRTNSNPASTGGAAQYDFVIKDDGVVSVKALDLEGADVAERFTVETSANDALTMKPGVIVSIDAQHPGSLVMSDRAFDHRVAGVVSGAGGIVPGVVMAGGTASTSYPIALSGRVYCWADASHSPISPGDFLTTSSVPGHAMKANSYSEAQGSIIGKAMTGLADGRGLVLILVTLQ